MLPGIQQVELSTCECYLACKSTRKRFGKVTRVDFPIQLVHSDICGPMNIKDWHEAFYFVNFTDDYTRFGQVYVIAQTSNVLRCFVNHLFTQIWLVGHER